MANMSYCRFQNTVQDFEGCLEFFQEQESIDDLSAEEKRAAKKLIRLAVQMAEYQDLLNKEAA